MLKRELLRIPALGAGVQALGAAAVSVRTQPVPAAPTMHRRARLSPPAEVVEHQGKCG